jgi:hypothetical protein
VPSCVTPLPPSEQPHAIQQLRSQSRVLKSHVYGAVETILGPHSKGGLSMTNHSKLFMWNGEMDTSVRAIDAVVEPAFVQVSRFPQL